MEIPTPEPPLAEAEIALRPWCVEDAPVLAQAWADPRAAVGFWLDAAHRRNNLAAKALRLLADWALANLPLDTLAGEASSENPASGWTLQAAGFTLITERATRQAWIREAK